jgi:DNA-binding transcriptional ArsR family regulator
MIFLARVPPVREDGREEQRVLLRQRQAAAQQDAGKAHKQPAQAGEDQPQQPEAQQQQARGQQPKSQQRPAQQQQADANEFEQICRLFGALSGRDTGRTVVRVYRVVVEKASPEKGIGSSELAEIERLNRLTAMHHLNRLAELGMLEKRGPRYFARDFDEIFDEFEKQALENIKRARMIARQLERQE